MRVLPPRAFQSIIFSQTVFTTIDYKRINFVRHVAFSNAYDFFDGMKKKAECLLLDHLFPSKEGSKKFFLNHPFGATIVQNKFGLKSILIVSCQSSIIKIYSYYTLCGAFLHNF